MTRLTDIIELRKFGCIRYSVVSDYSGDLNKVLLKFGLIPDCKLLEEYDRKNALAILSVLLWKDMAFNSECMPETTARDFAYQIISEYETNDCKFFSNGNWVEKQGWNPMTESTFDAGIIITRQDNVYFCIWIEDED